MGGGQADLAISVFTVAAPSPFGLVPTQAPSDVTLVIRNFGQKTASNITVEFSEIQVDGSRRVLQSFIIDEMPPGGGYLHRTQWQPYFDRIGDFDLTAVVDPRDTIKETTEKNNAKHARATSRMPAPGLLFPARSIFTPTQGPVHIGGEWATYLFDRHDQDNPLKGYLLDRSGNGRDVAVPAPADFTSGLDSNGALFNGQTEYVLDWSGALTLDGATVTFWIKLDERPRFGQFAWSVAAGPCYRQAVELRPEGTLRFWAPTAAGGCVDFVDSTERLPLGIWQHVAVTWQRGLAFFYVNGELVATSNPGTIPRPTHGPFTIGALDLGSPSHPPRAHLNSAVLDEVRLYNRALTAVEVQALHGLGTKIYVG